MSIEEALTVFSKHESRVYSNLPPLPSGVQLIKAFLALRPTITDDVLYWHAVREVYCSSDNPIGLQSELKAALTEPRKYRSRSLMNSYERNYYRQLPQRFNIFRAMSWSEFDSKDFGIAWYDDYSSAILRCVENTNNTAEKYWRQIVLKTEIDKKDMIGVINKDGRFEIIVCKPITRWKHVYH
jgi:hypothetical protein